MKIEKDKVVTIHYCMRDCDSEGSILEDTNTAGPVTFTYGHEQMIRGFEKQLIGLSPGDKFDFHLVAKEAYGEKNPNAIVSIPLQNFAEKDGKVDPTKVAINKSIRMKSKSGRSYQGTVIKVSTDAVSIDFNHPMAGRDLHFSGHIVSVQDDLGL